MSTYRVYTYGAAVLRKKSEDVTEFGDELSAFLDDMVETMMVEDGVGLAASQVGVSRRAMVVNPEPGNPDTLLRLINPKITQFSEETESMEEGCLSVPGIRGNVTRPIYLVMEYQDEKGNPYKEEFGGLAARVIQHEIDHLDGVMFVDRLSIAKKAMIRGKLRELSKRSREEE